jgi:hypothetical protein
LIDEAEAQANLAEKEAQERVSKVEAESVASLASCCGEADGFARRVALLEGELTVGRQARDKAVENFMVCLTGWMTSTDDGKMLRGSVRTWSRRLPFCKLGDLSCDMP